MDFNFYTPDDNVKFDFTSLIIFCYELEVADIPRIKEAISWDRKSGGFDEKRSRLRATLMHEVTHFLDMTTTAAGMQYAIRKNLFLDSIDTEREETQAKVFMLEAAEYAMHHELIRAGAAPALECPVIQHALRYDERYGGYVTVLYVRNGQFEHEVPLSMLSLIEANAIANEYLFELEDVQSIEDVVDRTIQARFVEERFIDLINDPTKFEYSVLIYVARIHFQDVSLRTLLHLVAAVCRFTLAAEGGLMALIANWMEGSAVNREVGWMISMEMRRGASRHVVAFKTILFLYGWIETAAESNRESIRDLILNDPYLAVEKLWQERLRIPKVYFDVQKLEWSASMRILAKQRTLPDHQVFAENDGVRQLLSGKPAGLCDFSDFTLLDLQLGDDASVAMPRPSAVAARAHFNRNMNNFSAIESGLGKRKLTRFHIRPGDELLPFNPFDSSHVVPDA